LGCIVFTRFTSCHHYLVSEDSLVENLTVTFYFFAILLAISFLVLQKGHKMLVLIILALGILCALDELSYGKRKIMRKTHLKASQARMMALPTNLIPMQV